jgi:hypothetical protein
VIQLETAVGAAMKSFEGGLGKWSKHADISVNTTPHVLQCAREYNFYFIHAQVGSALDLYSEGT